jgi:tetratricopeptide (TPR) repeat protein
LVRWATESLVLRTWSDSAAKNQSLFGLLLFGLWPPAEAPLARELLVDLYLRESSDIWRGVLRRVRSEPFAYVEDACAMSGGFEEARRLAEGSSGRPLLIPATITPEWAERLLTESVAGGGKMEADRAIRELNERVARDPSRPWLHFALGNWLAQIKEYERSVEEFWIAAKLELGWDLPRARIGEVLMVQGRDAEASRHMESVSCDLTTIGDHFWLVLGETRRRADKLSGAVEALGRCLSITPDHPQALESMATCHLRLGNRSEARQYAKRARQFGDSPTLKRLDEDRSQRSGEKGSR